MSRLARNKFQAAKSLLAKSALALGLVACAATAQATLVGLSSGSPGHLYDVNATTGAATVMATLPAGGYTSLVGMEYMGGKYYASDVNTGSGWAFGTIDPTTGAFTTINNQGGSANWHGLAGNESAQVLYAIDLNNGSQLVSVTTAGVITFIGATGIDGRGMAYDDANGILYATGGTNLYRVNTATGAATLIGDMGFGATNVGLAYDEVLDILYANASTGSLYTLNVSTGASTVVGANGALAGGDFQIDGLAWVPDAVQGLPEPGSLALLGVALLGAATAARRRRG